MPLCVSLISGKTVVELEHFDGNGLELRERVGREMRVTPQRLRLVMSDNSEIKNEEMITNSDQAVTAMVGEGQELPEWCEAEMEFFSFNALEDGLSLPEGSLEISPKVLGKVIMLAIAKVSAAARRKYNQALKDSGMRHSYFDWSPEQDVLDEEEVNNVWLYRTAEREAFPKLKPHWQEAHDVLAKCKKAAYSFAKLDDRLKNSKNFFYSRWEGPGEENGGKRHRVYGIRQEFSAVEFVRVFDHFLELDGRFDQLAARSLTSMWQERITTIIWVERKVEVEELIERVRAFCSLLLLALQDPEHPHVAWVQKHADTVVGTLTNAFKKECFLLREASNWRHVHDTLADATKVLEAVVANWAMAAKVSEMLQEGLLTALLELAEERRDEATVMGCKLLMAYFPQDAKAQAVLQEQESYGWPHVRERVKSYMENPPKLNEEPEALPVDQLPSPRSLAMTSLRSNPISLPAVHKTPRRARRRQAHAESKHVLYDVGSDESDEDEDESE